MSFKFLLVHHNFEKSAINHCLVPADIISRYIQHLANIATVALFLHIKWLNPLDSPAGWVLLSPSLDILEMRPREVDSSQIKELVSIRVGLKPDTLIPELGALNLCCTSSRCIWHRIDTQWVFGGWWSNVIEEWRDPEAGPPWPFLLTLSFQYFYLSDLVLSHNPSLFWGLSPSSSAVFPRQSPLLASPFFRLLNFVFVF